MSKSLGKLPEIVIKFPFASENESLMRHTERGKEILKRIFPKEFETLYEKGHESLEQLLPLIKWDVPPNVPDTLSAYFLFQPKGEVNMEKHLPEILRRWLIPEKNIVFLGSYFLNFFMPEVSTRPYFLAEIQVLVEEWGDLTCIEQNLPSLANDIIIALTSSKYLEEMLETKALVYEQKAAKVQYYLRQLTKQFPNQFDSELFREMNVFFALASPSFHKFRLPKHLAKIIVSHFLMRKRLLESFSISPQKRQLELRFFRSRLHFPFGVKSVLGLSIAVGLVDRHETFEETHVISAIQKFIPNAQIVRGSYYFYRPNHSTIKHLYLEIEKREGGGFSLQEVGLLKSILAEELKNRIEKLIPFVFMTRNEEEIMRNMLLLSQELKYLHDIPQVIVNLDRQEAQELYFTAIVVRVLKKEDSSLEQAFAQVSQPFRFIPDRVQNVGYVRKKNPKEANVFHLSIPKEGSILRTDSSVNFYLARQKIISIIGAALGEFRDYNGGMLLKQGELFSQLKHVFSNVGSYKQELLEDFFFSLNPIEAQATATSHSLIALFEILLESIDTELPKKESVYLKFKADRDIALAALKTKDATLEPVLNEELQELKDFSKLLIRTKAFFQGSWFHGLIYQTPNLLQQKQLEECIRRAIEKWTAKMVSLQELHLTFISLPPTHDPRMVGDEIASLIIKMLFEGLCRISFSGEPELALAQSVEISSDQKRYTFKLRSSFWSNQKKLVAQDFEYAWKKVLSPSFYTAFAYFFYPIKNAKEAKEGKVPLEEVGIKAIDELTLVVDLENPTPEFLEFTAHSLYSPVCQSLETLHPNWAQSTDEGFVCNGPFKLKRLHPNGKYELMKNPVYWDHRAVKLDRVFFGKSEMETAHQMYKNGEIDWIGRPTQPFDVSILPEPDDISSYRAYGVTWCTFNTQRFPFNNLKIRVLAYFV